MTNIPIVQTVDISVLATDALTEYVRVEPLTDLSPFCHCPHHLFMRNYEADL